MKKNPLTWFNWKNDGVLGPHQFLSTQPREPMSLIELMWAESNLAIQSQGWLTGSNIYLLNFILTVSK